MRTSGLPEKVFPSENPPVLLNKVMWCENKSGRPLTIVLTTVINLPFPCHQRSSDLSVQQDLWGCPCQRDIGSRSLGSYGTGSGSYIAMRKCPLSVLIFRWVSTCQSNIHMNFSSKSFPADHWIETRWITNSLHLWVVLTLYCSWSLHTTWLWHCFEF